MKESYQTFIKCFLDKMEHGKDITIRDYNKMISDIDISLIKTLINYKK